MLDPKPGRTVSRPSRILSKVNLLRAWRESRDSTAHAGRPGIDNITAQQFASNLGHNIDVIVKQLRTGTYGFSRLRPVFIPKPHSAKERMICIPTVRDRLVQRAIVRYLVSTKRFPIYNSSSFGFIKGRGTREAINASVNFRGQFSWCLKTDIESFFDRIPRAYLTSRVLTVMRSNSIAPLLWNIIKSEVRELPDVKSKIQKQGIRKGVGVRQGMPLSPILSNLVLSNFDRQIEARQIKMVRYADDLALFFHSKQEAVEGKDLVSRLLQQVELTIPHIANDSKTRLVGPDDPLDFLGREIVCVGTERRYIARVSRFQVAQIRAQLEEEYCFSNRSKSDSNFQKTVVDLWRSVSAYLGIYKDAYNFPALDSELRAAGRSIISNIFLDIFGIDALTRVSEQGKQFLGIEKLMIPEPLDDLQI